MSEARRIHIDIGVVCRKCQEQQIFLHFKPIRDAAEADKASTYDPMEHERDYS